MMSPLCARMNKKKEVVLNSVAEFLGIWALRGEASLSLKTKDGVTTIAFTHSLSGHPEDPLHPPPPSPTGSSPQRRRRRRRRRGPARRERDRQRAACHQAAQAGASPATTPSAASAPAPSIPDYLGRRIAKARRPIVPSPTPPPTTPLQAPPSLPPPAAPHEFCPHCDGAHDTCHRCFQPIECSFPAACCSVPWQKQMQLGWHLPTIPGS